MRVLRMVAVVALLLAAGAPTGPVVHAQAGRGFTTDFQLSEFAARRARIYDAIGSEAVALMQGLPSVHSSAIFRQSNEFFYVSGVVAPQALLLMDGASRRTTLYLPKQNVSRAATEGEVLSSDDPARTARITGVDDVKTPDQLAADLQALTRARAVFVPFAPTEGASESPDGARRRTADVVADPWDGRVSREDHLRALLAARAPTLDVRDLSPILNTMREIKSPAEIAVVTRVSTIGGEAILEAMRSTEPGLAEYELDAVAQLINVRNGAQGEAYRAIVASGVAATNPHHRAGPKLMTDGELVLMDYCPDLGYYRCDITRQWPVNGKFNRDQRDLYGFYLGAYEALLYAITPGQTAQQIVQKALPKMEQVLAAATFSKALYQEAANQFVERYRASARGERPANLGHAVGMATHDFGGGSGTMRPGMVFTIEPALTVPSEQIYIRLEDMILITESGAKILSDFVPRTIEAVERMVAEPGLLQRYSRIRKGS